MDSSTLAQQRHPPTENRSLLSDIFADSPLLQGLRKARPSSSHTSPYTHVVASDAAPTRTSQQAPNSVVGEDWSKHIKSEDWEEGLPPAKRARLDAGLEVLESIESERDNGYRPIAKATAALRRTWSEPERPPPKIRTRTGCYTCRKRRVKCDQGRPVCLRCTRAKRECEGYDPTLEPGPIVHLPELEKKQRIIPNPRGRGRKRQPTPPSAAVQLSTKDRSSSVGDGASLNRSRSGSRRSSLAKSATDTRAAMLPGINDDLGAAFDAHMNGTDIDFTDTIATIALDPALAEAGSNNSDPQQQPPPPTQELPASHHAASGAPQLFGFSSFTADTDNNDSSINNADSHNNNAGPKRREPLTMAALCKVGGEDPPKAVPAPQTPQDDLIKEIDYLYRTTYAPAIDAFLECQWFGQHSITYLEKSQETMTCFISVLHLFKDTKSEQYDLMRRLPSSESELIWALMRLPRSVPESLAIQSPELQVVLNRLLVVERLITGQQMAEPPIDDSVIQNTTHKKQEKRVKFWRCLNEFVNTPRLTSAEADDDPAAESSMPGASKALKDMRGVLEGLENRDVLYSIAVVQHYGGKFPGEVGRSFTPVSNGKANGHSAQDKADLDKLRVAKRFLEDEAQDQGMSQVVQRLCGMAVRSWNHLIS